MKLASGDTKLFARAFTASRNFITSTSQFLLLMDRSFASGATGILHPEAKQRLYSSVFFTNSIAASRFDALVCHSCSDAVGIECTGKARCFFAHHRVSHAARCFLVHVPLDD